MSKSKTLNRFNRQTINTLAKRAGYICSNPYCGSHTSGPHSDDTKAVTIDEAAHIRGAEPGSARYDASMSPTERRNIINGIWLCRKCSRLIDLDEKKYTVEILYNWKREHEEKMEIELTQNGWQRKVEEMSLKPLENESPAAQQIAIDKPEYWEHLLTVELLRSKLGRIKRDFSDLQRGLIYRPSRLLDEHQFVTWIREKLGDLQAIIHLLITSSTEELPASWGKLGEPGDALEIQRAVDKIVLGCQSLLEWEIDVHFTSFPDEYDHIKQKMQGWTEHFLAEMERIPKEITKVFDDPNPKGTYYINLVFEAPDNIHGLQEEIVKLMKRYTA